MANSVTMMTANRDDAPSMQVAYDITLTHTNHPQIWTTDATADLRYTENARRGQPQCDIRGDGEEYKVFIHPAHSLSTATSIQPPTRSTICLLSTVSPLVLEESIFAYS